MITKWGKLLAACTIFGIYNWYVIPVKDKTGASVNVGITNSSGGKPWPSDRSYQTTFTTSNVGIGISLGSGSTPAAETDYALESIITSGISTSIITAMQQDSNGNPQTIDTITVTNTGSSDITIGEIGMTVTPKNSGTLIYVLVDRTVLDSPITIPANESAVITYTITHTA